jgi:hypothetical protein
LNTNVKKVLYHFAPEHTLETIREEWCSLVADMKTESSTAINEILTIILETDVPQAPAVKLSKNGELVNQNADLGQIL